MSENFESTPVPALRATDLTAEERGWQPRTVHDLWAYVMPWKTEQWVPHDDDEAEERAAIQLTSAGDPPWDWRTVAFWRSALPHSWDVRLSTPYRVTLTPPPDDTGTA